MVGVICSSCPAGGFKCNVGWAQYIEVMFGAVIVRVGKKLSLSEFFFLVRTVKISSIR
jgi:hypothetical protein